MSHQRGCIRFWKTMKLSSSWIGLDWIRIEKEKKNLSFVLSSSSLSLLSPVRTANTFQAFFITVSQSFTHSHRDFFFITKIVKLVNSRN
jgi:hypothetical protein